MEGNGQVVQARYKAGASDGQPRADGREQDEAETALGYLPLVPTGSQKTHSQRGWCF